MKYRHEKKKAKKALQCWGRVEGTELNSQFSMDIKKVDIEK